jgi:hypothetical protein
MLPSQIATGADEERKERRDIGKQWLLLSGHDFLSRKRMYVSKPIWPPLHAGTNVEIAVPPPFDITSTLA